MTHDEVLALKPGKEMDDLISLHVTGYKRPSRDKEGYIPEHDFKFSSKLEHAEYVIDILRENWMPHLIDCGQWGWRVDLLSDSEGREDIVCPSQECLPEAICKAALLAVMGRIEEDQNPWLSWHSSRKEVEAELQYESSPQYGFRDILHKLTLHDKPEGDNRDDT